MRLDLRQKAKVSNVHLYNATIAAYAASAALLLKTGPAYSLGHSQARAHGLRHLAAHNLPFSGLQLRNLRKYRNHYSFTNPGGMEG